MTKHEAIDRRFFGLADGDTAHSFRFVAHARLCRPDARLYGGTAIGVAFAATEIVTGRRCIWQTTQLVASAPVDAEIDVAVEVVAAGHKATQVRVVGTLDGAPLFESLGAAVIDQPEAITGTAQMAPDVPHPDDCPAGAFGIADFGWFPGLEARLAHEAEDHRALQVWVRCEDGLGYSAARLAFVADLVPMGIMRSLGRHGGGISLDNTLRIGPMPDTEWVLIEVQAQQASGGFGHGVAHLWTPEGELVGTASQTTKLMEFEWDPLVRIPRH